MNAGLEFWFFVMLTAILSFTLLSAVLFPLLRSGLNMLRPAMRANVLLGWCIAPIAFGVLIAFSPWLLSALGLAPENCGRLSDAFLAGRIWPVVFDAVLLAPLVWFIFSSARRIRTAVRLNSKISSLVAVGRPYANGDIAIIDSNKPLAFASGLYRSRIIIASCLQHSLSEAQMRAVISHERAHASRRDALRYLVAEVVSVAHLPWVKSSLLADLQLATEQACDEAAVQAGGDRLGVAETLLRVERLFGRQSDESGIPVHLLGGDLEARVEALVAGQPCTNTGRWRHMILMLAIVCGVVALIGAVPLHEFMGSFLVYVKG